MFGLFRALKKQSGGLFLAKRHSVDSVETRGSIKTKRGAMFGLDARIALAIFGALSVISGAALYNAIQEAKVVALITEINEIGKAYNSYRLDIGTNVGTLGGAGDPNDEIVRFKDLIESSVSGWQGPYLSYEEDSVNGVGYLKHNGYTSFGLRRYEPSETGPLNSKNKLCTTGNLCSVWIMYMPVSLDIVNAVEERIDGIIDQGKGNVRGFVAGSNQFMMVRIADEF